MNDGIVEWLGWGLILALVIPAGVKWLKGVILLVIDCDEEIERRKSVKAMEANHD